VAERRLVFDLSWEAWRQLMSDWGEPAFRADQVWTALYRNLVRKASQITTLPLELRDRLAQEFAFCSLSPTATLTSTDGETEKLLLHSADGQAVEAVLMRYNTRRTACISTQAGCAMGCVFCATGQMGFQRNLTSGEIIEQVLAFARQLAEKGERLTNVVVMGMGEPLHNYEATLDALDRLNHPDGFNFGARRSTISTVGLVPKVRQFTAEGRPYNLAVSLHAATDSLRAELLPIARRYPLDDLMRACDEYTRVSGRRISFEWALIAGVNDTQEQAQALSRLIGHMLCHVNLIPLNPTRGYSGGPSPLERANAFKGILENRGIACTIRVRRGIDIQAGCGQLATEKLGAR
jgi:23S rRNA (adenine2503-C2)-methyltransferase